ncbi:MAG: FHA domain-containing protein [Chloroflexota bacterium]
MTGNGKKKPGSEQHTTRNIKPRAAMPMYERSVSAEVPNSILFEVLATGKTVEHQFSGELTLGRTISDPAPPTHADMTALMPKNAGVSRIHVRISVHEGLPCIEDLGSTNGTLLNGFKLEPFTKVGLKDGDLLEPGKFKLKVIFKF